MFFFFLDRLANQNEVQALRSALAEARRVVPDISVGTLATFLDLAAQAHDEPKSTKDVATACAIPYARLMRQVEVLSDGSRRSPGHHLLEKVVNPEDRRSWIMLSSKGQILLAAMSARLRAADEENVAG